LYRWAGWYSQAKEGKSEERFVDATDHDAHLFGPMLDVAHVGQGGAHVPRQETPAEGPEQGEEGVDGEVEGGFEAGAAV